MTSSWVDFTQLVTQDNTSVAFNHQESRRYISTENIKSNTVSYFNEYTSSVPESEAEYGNNAAITALIGNREDSTSMSTKYSEESATSAMLNTPNSSSQQPEVTVARDVAWQETATGADSQGVSVVADHSLHDTAHNDQLTTSNNQLASGNNQLAVGTGSDQLAGNPADSLSPSLELPVSELSNGSPSHLQGSASELPKSSSEFPEAFNSNVSSSAVFAASGGIYSASTAHAQQLDKTKVTDLSAQFSSSVSSTQSVNYRSSSNEIGIGGQLGQSSVISTKPAVNTPYKIADTATREFKTTLSTTNDVNHMSYNGSSETFSFVTTQQSTIAIAVSLSVMLLVVIVVSVILSRLFFISRRRQMRRERFSNKLAGNRERVIASYAAVEQANLANHQFSSDKLDLVISEAIYTEVDRSRKRKIPLVGSRPDQVSLLQQTVQSHVDDLDQFVHEDTDLITNSSVVKQTNDANANHQIVLQTVIGMPDSSNHADDVTVDASSDISDGPVIHSLSTETDFNRTLTSGDVYSNLPAMSLVSETFVLPTRQRDSNHEVYANVAPVAANLGISNCRPNADAVASVQTATSVSNVNLTNLSELEQRPRGAAAGMQVHEYDPVYVPHYDPIGLQRRLDSGYITCPRRTRRDVQPYEIVVIDDTLRDRAAVATAFSTPSGQLQSQLQEILHINQPLVHSQAHLTESRHNNQSNPLPQQSQLLQPDVLHQPIPPVRIASVGIIQPTRPVDVIPAVPRRLTARTPLNDQQQHLNEQQHVREMFPDILQHAGHVRSQISSGHSGADDVSVSEHEYTAVVCVTDASSDRFSSTSADQPYETIDLNHASLRTSFQS